MDNNAKRIEEKLKEYHELSNHECSSSMNIDGSKVTHTHTGQFDDKDSSLMSHRSRSSSWSKFGVKPKSIRASVIEENVMLSRQFNRKR